MPTFSPSGDRLLFVEEGELFLFDRDGRLLGTLSKPDGLRAPCFNPTGERLLETGPDGNGWLWSAADGTEVARLEGMADTVTIGGLANGFTADGKRRVGFDGQGTARLWHGETGELGTVRSKGTAPA